MKAGVPNKVTWSGADVDVTTVEREMAELWSGVRGPDAVNGAVRTHFLNLIAFSPDMEGAKKICKALHELPEARPSRTVILVGDRDDPRNCLDADVTVECQDVEHRCLCHEQVVIEAHGRSADHLSSVVIPLLISELPTYLWWPGQPPFGYRTLHRLLEVADQLVIDSGQFSAPGDGFANLTRLCVGHQGVNDFHWARLTPWRDIIAQLFDAPKWIPYLFDISSIRLEMGSGGENHRTLTSSALLLLGWMASSLDWEPDTTVEWVMTKDTSLSFRRGRRIISVDVVLRDHGAQAAGRLLGVVIRSEPADTAPAEFEIRRTPDMEHAEVRASVPGDGDVCRVVPLTIKSDIELLARELQLAGHDKLYETVVEMAGRIAGREVWDPV